MYCSGTRGPSRNPGLCSLKCADWRPLSPGLFVGDVGVGRVGSSLCVGASSRCSLSRSSELGVGDVGVLLWAQEYSLDVPSRGWKPFSGERRRPPCEGGLEGSQRCRSDLASSLMGTVSVTSLLGSW